MVESCILNSVEKSINCVVEMSEADGRIARSGGFTHSPLSIGGMVFWFFFFRFFFWNIFSQIDFGFVGKRRKIKFENISRLSRIHMYDNLENEIYRLRISRGLKLNAIKSYDWKYNFCRVSKMRIGRTGSPLTRNWSIENSSFKNSKVCHLNIGINSLVNLFRI